MGVEVINGVKVKYNYVKHVDSQDVVSKVEYICDYSPDRYFGKDGTLYVYSCGSIKVYVLVRGDGEATMYIEACCLKPGDKKEFDEVEARRKASFFIAFFVAFFGILVLLLPPPDVLSAFLLAGIFVVVITFGGEMLVWAQKKGAEDVATLNALLKL